MTFLRFPSEMASGVDATAEDAVAIVEGADLAGSEGALLCGEAEEGASVGLRLVAGGHARVPVAHADLKVPGLCRRFGNEPAEVVQPNFLVPEGIGMAALKGDDQFIAVHPFGDNDVELVLGVGRNPDTAALAEGVAVKTAVLPETPALEIDDGTRLVGNEGFEEIIDFHLPDKADALAVLLPGVGETESGGDPPHLRLGKVADGKDGAPQLLRSKQAEEIALVLVLVHSLLQGGHAPDLLLAAVMAGGDSLETVLKGPVEEDAEFHFPVAHDIRIRREPGSVSIQ